MNTWWDMGSAIALLVLMAFASRWVQGKRYTASKCGHDTYLVGGAMVLGETPCFKLPLVNGAPEYCIGCIAGMAVRCAWCSRPIHVGDLVTLYVRQEGMPLGKQPVAYREDENNPYRRYVGCLRSSCADTSADRAGFWEPPGLVRLVPTPYEQSLAALARGGNGAVISQP